MIRRPRKNCTLNKTPDALRSIGEAANEVGVPQHVLRYWELNFTEISPVRR